MGSAGSTAIEAMVSIESKRKVGRAMCGVWLGSMEGRSKERRRESKSEAECNGKRREIRQSG